MYPHFHSWHHAARWYRGPSRLLWFSIGAVSATIWAKHKEWHERHGRQYYEHCFRAPVQAPPNTVQTSPYPGDGRPTADVMMIPIPTSLKSVPESINRIPPAQDMVPSVPWMFGYQHQDQRWDQEKAKMWDLGRQAGDTMTELSEATLDSVISTVEALKAKLAEHRARREEQQKQIEEQREAEKVKPFRWT
ncbi:hypothetical protein HGRIS_002069 [Hohenbuehelia grisea]|uniref:Uncharacterized protein n=1 Tax=Hohenbuehelia grisea TaxID=104357 RepID=A0ABR3JL63_9AGAR